MDPLTSLKLIKVHHQELRADAARARRAHVARRIQRVRPRGPNTRDRGSGNIRRRRAWTR
jgi:hypothetical protein